MTGGLSGKQHDVRRGDDRIVTSVVGPFTTVRGTIAGRAWHHENGTTVREEPEAAPHPTATPLMTLARVARPRDLWLVTSRHPSGELQKTFYDPRDLAVVREEVSLGSHAAHVDYNHFRPWVTGLRRAWQATGADDRGTTFATTIVRDDVAPAIPDGVNQVALPATVENGRIHVKVDVDGNPLTFVLDTGASGIFIDAQAAEDIHLPVYGSRAFTVAGTFTSQRVVSRVVRVGTLAMRDVVMSTAPLDAREAGTRVDGLLGFDFIAGAVLRIDYVDPGGVTASVRASLPLRRSPRACYPCA